MEQFLRVGVISSTHGIKGEVKVFPTTDDVNRYKDLKEVFLDTGKGRILMELEQVKFHKNMVIVKFKGYDNINDIEMYKGKDLLISREHAVSLAPDENFIIDLIGLKVVTDEGKDFGTVKDILQTGANDVYMIDGNDGKEYLFPSIKECILDVNLEEGKVTVHILAFWTCKEYIIYEFSHSYFISRDGNGRPEHKHYRACHGEGPDIGGGRQYPGLFHRQAPACRRLSLRRRSRHGDAAGACLCGLRGS